MTVVRRGQDRLPAPPWAMFAILCIAAVAQSISASWPFDAFFSKGQLFWWMQPIALALLVFAGTQAPTPKAAAHYAWWFATVWLSTTFWWLYVAMHTYGGLPSLLAAVAVIALAGALAAYYAGAMWAWRRWALGTHWGAIVGFAALWLMAEMARGTWLTGFGWGAIGYAHIDGPLAFFLPWIGSYGVSALAAAWAASLAVAVARRQIAPAVWVSVLLVAPTLLPAGANQWTTPTGTLQVTLLQGNIPQDEKFETGSGVPLALQWYRDALLQAEGDLVVAPETAIPLLPQQLPEGYWASLSSRFETSAQAALVGIPLGSYQAGYTNSVVALAAGQTGWQYDKHHLVPFGEFIPPLFKWFTRLMNIPLGDFNRGPLGQPSLAVKGERVAPNICYEDLYGEELATRFTDAALAPTVFANVSNLGWFNRSVALDQHLHSSRTRALEFQRPFVRATNTGATAILSHEGVVQDLLPPQTRGVLRGEVQGRSGITPFAWWASRYGLWPLWLIALAVLAVLWRQRDSHPPS